MECRRDVRFSITTGRQAGGTELPKCAKLGRDGLSFGIFNALRGRAFFPDRQREAQLLPDITRRGCGSVLFWTDASAIGCSGYCLRNFPLVLGSPVAI